MELLGLHGAIRRHAERRQHAITIAAFEPCAVALPDEIRRNLIPQGGAVGGEPVIGERQRAGNVGRPEPRDAVAAGLQGIAAPGAEPVAEPPIGAAAGQRKADQCGWRDAIVHAAGEAEGRGRDSCWSRPPDRPCWSCRRRRPSPMRSSAARSWPPALCRESRRRPARHRPADPPAPLLQTRAPARWPYCRRGQGRRDRASR